MQNRFRTLRWASAFVFALGIATAAGDIVELRDGERLQAPSVAFENGTFLLPDGARYSRQDVRNVWFEKADPGSASEASSGDVALTTAEDADWIADRFRDAARLEAAYPDVRGVILVDEGRYELRADGTRVSRTRFVGKVLKTSAQGWGRLTVWFEEERERVKIIRARTILPDGSVLELPEEAFRVAEPYRGLLFFSRYKVIAGELPQVTPGCVVDFEYEEEVYNPFDRKMFSPAFLFQGEEPVALSRFEIVAPEGQELVWNARRMPEGAREPVESREGTRVSRVWEVRDMPPVLSEPAMPALEDIVPSVRTSVFENWDYIFDWLRKAQDQRIVVTPEIEEITRNLTDEATSDDQRVAAIYHFLQRNIRYVSIKGGVGSGFSGHRADETLRAGYGDCIDKAILFAAMAKAIDIRCEPIILMTNDRTDRLYDLPVLAGNHAISKIVLPDRSFFLDSTASTYRYPAFRADSQGAMCINAQAGLIEPIDLLPPEMEGGRTLGTLEMDGAGDATVRYELHLSGSPEAGTRARVEHSKEEELKRLFTELVANFSPDAVLSRVAPHNTLDLSRPFRIDLDFELPGWGIAAGSLMIVGVPGTKYEFGEAALQERSYDVEYGSLNQQEHSVVLRMPEGYRVRSVPDPVEFDCPYGSYRAGYEVRGDEVVFEDRFRRTERIVPVEDYATYRDFLREVARSSRERIFLERTEGGRQ